MIEEQLLASLSQHASARGLVIATEARLVRELGVSREALIHGLRSLELEGRVRILSPLPYLALKLVAWSGSSTGSDRSAQQSSSSRARSHIEVPVSSSFAAAATQSEDGGAGEGEALLDEVVVALGPEADRDEFRTILAGYSPVLVRRCLARVRATKSIRVSRAALFRSLLSKLIR